MNQRDLKKECMTYNMFSGFPESIQMYRSLQPGYRRHIREARRKKLPIEPSDLDNTIIKIVVPTVMLSIIF